MLEVAVLCAVLMQPPAGGPVKVDAPVAMPARFRVDDAVAVEWHGYSLAQATSGVALTDILTPKALLATGTGSESKVSYIIAMVDGVGWARVRLAAKLSEEIERIETADHRYLIVFGPDDESVATAHGETFSGVAWVIDLQRARICLRLPVVHREWGRHTVHSCEIRRSISIADDVLHVKAGSARCPVGTPSRAGESCQKSNAHCASLVVAAGRYVFDATVEPGAARAE